MLSRIRLPAKVPCHMSCDMVQFVTGILLIFAEQETF